MHLIAEHFLKKVITSNYFFSKNPVRDITILYLPFYEKVQKSIASFKEVYPNIEVFITETYRSNALQLQYFNQGASKIRKNGMHFYAVSCDIAFKINGQLSYNADYKLLRQYHIDNGLHILTAWDKPHVQYIPVSQQTELRNTVDKAVRQFQKENGLTIDGVVGRKTQAKAKEIYST